MSSDLRINLLKKLLVITLLIGQFGLVASFLLVPKPAEALFGVGDFTFNLQIANWYDVFKDIGLAAAQRIATSYANKYLQKFTSKVVDKYRIKSYLFYTNVLSGYYLNQYIYEKVDDPNLQAIYNLLAEDVSSSATFTDPVTGQTQPALSALRQKLDKYFVDNGGVDYNFLNNPPPNISSYDYLYGVYAHYLNTPDFSNQYLAAQFAQINAQAQAAAQTENLTSGGYKNDRTSPQGFTSNICVGYNPGPYTSSNNPKANSANCLAAGGQWKLDPLGIAQTFIQNPAQSIQNFVDQGIAQIFADNFDSKTSNPLFTTVGGLLGNYIFSKLNLDTTGSSVSSAGVFNEYGPNYTADSGYQPAVREVDLDKDNIPDGQDGNGDGNLNTVGVDTCYHGGTPPSCTPSSTGGFSPYYTPICQALDTAVKQLTDFANFIDVHAYEMEDPGSTLTGTVIPPILAMPYPAFYAAYGNINLAPTSSSGTIDNFKNSADADIWARKSGDAEFGVSNLLNAVETYNNAALFDDLEKSTNRYSSYMSRVVQSLEKDKDLDLSRSGSGGGGLYNLMLTTSVILRYLMEEQVTLGEKCDKPNIASASQVPAPNIDLGQNSGSGGSNGGNNGNCGQVVTSTGSASNPSTLDLNNATIVNSPSDVANWPQTYNIDAVNDIAGDMTISSDGILNWPVQAGAPGDIIYSVWLFYYINGQWYGSAGQVNYTRDGNTSVSIYETPCLFYYNSSWDPMGGHVIVPGEHIGVMLTSGDARNGGFPGTDPAERTNVFMITAP